MLVQRRRDTLAALRLRRKLLKKQGFAPKLLVTDKLGSYGSAFRQLRLTCPHDQGPQHLQPSTTSRLSVHAPDLQSRSNRPVARCGCRRMKRGLTSPPLCTRPLP